MRSFDELIEYAITHPIHCMHLIDKHTIDCKHAYPDAINIYWVLSALRIMLGLGKLSREVANSYRLALHDHLLQRPSDYIGDKRKHGRLDIPTPKGSA